MELLKRFGSGLFDIGSSSHSYMSLTDFMTYCQTTDDHAPKYIFEPRYGERYPSLLDDYAVPPYFSDDYLAYLGSTPVLRPYYRWLLIGAPNSGFTLHQDPNGTSAWNSLIVGRKRWVMFPPSIPESQLFLPLTRNGTGHSSGAGACGGNVESDTKSPADDAIISVNDNDDDNDDDNDKFHGSAVDWFENVYPTLKERASELGMYEFIQEPGDTVFVPYDWWHIVLNLPANTTSDKPSAPSTPAATPAAAASSMDNESKLDRSNDNGSNSDGKLDDISIAVTQNYLSWHHYPVVLERYYNACADGALAWFNALPPRLQGYVTPFCSFLTPKSDPSLSSSTSIPHNNTDRPPK